MSKCKKRMYTKYKCFHKNRFLTSRLGVWSHGSSTRIINGNSPELFQLAFSVCFFQKVFSAIYTLTYLVWYISVAGGSVGISCCCRQLADGLAQYIYPHKFCIAHGLRLLLYMALISSNIYRVLLNILFVNVPTQFLEGNL